MATTTISFTNCPGVNGKERLFIGTDDEDYGGAIRPLPDSP